MLRGTELLQLEEGRDNGHAGACEAFRLSCEDAWVRWLDRDLPERVDVLKGYPPVSKQMSVILAWTAVSEVYFVVVLAANGQARATFLGMLLQRTQEDEQ